VGTPVPVARDAWWNGKRHIGPGHFFVAHFAEEQPALVQSGLLPDERANLHKYVWVAWSDLDSLPDRIEPPQLLAVLAALVPEGPWPDPAL
jgi:hypothetical protein